MTPYQGLNESDYQILIFAVNKLDIKGSEAATIVMLLDKLEKEKQLLITKMEAKPSSPSNIKEVDGELLIQDGE